MARWRKARSVFALAAATAGVGCFALVPRQRAIIVRDRADLRRANSPLAVVPVRDLLTDHQREVRFDLPSDPQWHRIAKRLGPPEFLLVFGTDPPLGDRRAFPLPRTVAIEARQAGRTLALEKTNRMPFAYSMASQQVREAYAFKPMPGEPVNLRVGFEGVPPEPEALIMVWPTWSGLEMWDWGDGLSMGEGLFEGILVPVLRAIGVALLLVSLFYGVTTFRSGRQNAADGGRI